MHDLSATSQVSAFHLCSAGASSNPGFSAGALLVYRAGPKVILGLLCALLAVSALSRVHKVCNVFVELTRLSFPGGQTLDSCITGWLQAAIRQLPDGEMSACYICLLDLTDIQRKHCLSVAWLDHCCRVQRLKNTQQDNMVCGCLAGIVGRDEQTLFQSECCNLIQAIGAEQKQAHLDGSSGDTAALQISTASRNLKKCLRDFAECHQHLVL